MADSRSSELMGALQGFVGENLALLAPIDQAWQPTDFLPDLRAEDWSERLARFRESSQGLSDDLLVVLVGGMVTEEALPNYTVSLEQIAPNPTGTDPDPWARWLRGWTAEENRHGDLLNAYLRLTGRVDLRSVERTVHHLIAKGFASRYGGDASAGLMYASFQERATRISHGNVAKFAERQGDANLARICRKIAGDETRHETFYTRVVGQAFALDPEGSVLAFRSILRGLIAMPGRLMTDGSDPDLFDHFAAVAQRTGAYTARDYGEIVGHLVETWGIARLAVSGAAAKAQDYLCRQPERYARLAEEIVATVAAQPPARFSWIDGRQA